MYRARWLLGFASRSPTPAVCFEIGVVAWSLMHKWFCFRLLHRNYACRNGFVAEVVRCSSDRTGGWMRQVACMLTEWVPGGLPTTDSEWSGCLRRVESEMRQLWADAA